MPMIDVYAAAGTFADKRSLAKDLAASMVRWEKVPPIPLFIDNTAAFVHDLPADSFADAAGNGDCVRVQVLSPAGVLDQEKRLGIVKEMTDIIAAAANRPELAKRTWVLLTESPDGGWGLTGHAYTVAEIGAEARRILTAKNT